MVPVCLFPGTLTSLALQEEDTGEQGDIGGGHFLTGEDHAAIDLGALPTLSVSTALTATCIVIDAFQEVDMLMTQRVLVLIEMNDHVADLGALVSHGIIGGAFQITDFGRTLEEVDNEKGKLGLTGAFLAIDIQ